MGTNLQGYHLLWPDLPTFSQLQFTAPAPLQLVELLFRSLYQGRRLAWFFHHPIHNKSNETWRKRSENFAEALTRLVFLQTPNPLSLAATNGVSVDFPSFSYSDVSVR